MKSKGIALRRREFLLTLGTGAAATAVALTGRSSSSQVEPSGEKAGRTSAGYSETDHVRNYYRTTRI